MNCEQAGELMPLYIGDDLPAAAAHGVAAHVAQCAACQRLADEYRDSQDWLRSLAAPELPDASFARMRRAVRESIEASRPRRGDGFLAAVFGRPVPAAFAVVLALAGLCGHLAFRGAPADEQHKSAIAGVPAPAGRGAELMREVPPGEKSKGGVASSGRKKRLFAHKAVATVIAPPRTEMIGPLPMELTGLVDLPAPDVTDLLARRAAAQAPGEAPAEEFLRIEMQTADPQVRIIWFAPKAGDAPATRPGTD